MKGVIVGIVSAIVGMAAIGGIKMLELPGVISALLVVIVIALVLVAIAKGMAKKGSAAKQPAETGD